MRRREKDREKDNNEIRPSRGGNAILNRLVSLIAWPLRHKIVFIIALAVMFLAPTFMGIKPAEVHLWYLGQIKSTTSNVTDKVLSTSKDLMPNVSITLPSFEIKTPENNMERVIDTSDQQQMTRKMFGKAQDNEAPMRVDIMAQERNNPTLAPQLPVTTRKDSNLLIDDDQDYDYEAPAPTAEELRAQRRRSLDLIYLNSPQEFNGEAIIINANELIIGETPIFLFGIYIDPNTPQGLDGKDFLENLIGDNPVKCVVDAYTKQGIATGICFVNNISINHTMVERGISKDVAL